MRTRLVVHDLSCRDRVGSPVPAKAQARFTDTAKRKSEVIVDPLTGDVTVTLDDDGENWMQQGRLEQLRARGWQGTVTEYVQTWDRIGADPLEQTPPITRARG
jgi:hypothetical protein